MNLKIRLLLINIFTAEVLNWLSFIPMYLGWPARFINGGVISCKLFVSLIVCYLRSFEICEHFYICCRCLHVHKSWRQEVKMVCHNIIYCCNVDSGYPNSEHTSISWRLWSSKHQRVLCSQLILGYIGMAVSLTVGALFFLSIELISCILYSLSFTWNRMC